MLQIKGCSRFLLYLFYFCPLTILAGAASAAHELIYPAKQTASDIRNDYYLDLLKEALQVTEAEYGPFRLIPYKEYITQDRVFWLLGRNAIFDIAWSMTSKRRESMAHPVRIPAMQGLLGVRLAIVRKDRLGDFAKVNDLAGLQNYIAMQGHDWPDTEILQANGLRVETDFRYEEIFQRLALGRYDYFPRGALEAYAELEALQLDNLAVAPNFAIAYPAPTYFFVRKNNPELADRLTRGLETLVASGRLRDLLTSHPAHRLSIEQLKLPQRAVIRLHSPLLPDDTPLHRPELWWDPALFGE